MFKSSAFYALTLAAVSLAQGTPSVFSLQTTVDGNFVTARNGWFWTMTPNQAMCSPQGHSAEQHLDRAQFFFEDGKMYLYGGADDRTQQAFFDKSSGGEGTIAYTIVGDNRQLFPSTERVQFGTAAGGVLEVDGTTGFLTCPEPKPVGSNSVWVDIGQDMNSAEWRDCCKTTVLIVAEPDPVPCKYAPHKKSS